MPNDKNEIDLQLKPRDVGFVNWWTKAKWKQKMFIVSGISDQVQWYKRPENGWSEKFLDFLELGQLLDLIYVESTTQSSDCLTDDGIKQHLLRKQQYAESLRQQNTTQPNKE